MERPPVKYAVTADGVNIAYQAFGDGPVNVVFIGSWFGHVDVRWEYPGYAHWLERLASFARVVVFDKRGVGASDPAPPASLTLEAWIDDARAVMDAEQLDAAAIVAFTDATPVAVLFAATFPHRVRALVVVNWSLDIAQRMRATTPILDSWGTESMLASLERVAPSAANDHAYRAWFLRFARASASPGPARQLYEMLPDLSIESVLPNVQVPTLFVRRDSLPSSGDNARRLADLVPSSQFVEVAGRDIHAWVGDTDLLIDEVEAFLTGTRPVQEPDRALLTVVFSDMVGSTPKAVELGDRAWRALLEAHNTDVRREVDRYRGREVLTKGDEFLVTFDGPARAVRCAQAIHAAAASRDLQMRTGVHIGEVELQGGDIAGIAVHIGARVRELAEPDEILVTRTVKDLVAGSGLAFVDRGTHVLKGVPDEWQVYAVDDG